jgi:hypothetical protein
MAAKNHFMVPTAPTKANITARLGAQDAALTYAEDNKIVKLIAESAYGLAAAGDAIEGFVRGVELGSSNGYTIAGIYIPNVGDMVWAKADGLQATPGTGTLAIGEYVVTGSVTASGTSRGQNEPAKVCKATDQAAAKAGPFAYRVVSLAALGGAGAVGSYVVLQRVN